jgi:type III pantothenate kinase
MILAADVGNTNVSIGVYDDRGNQITTFRLATDLSRTEDQYALEISGVLAMRGIERGFFDLAALSCVVPPLSSVMKKALAVICGCRVVCVGPGVKSGLNIRIEDPAVLGADLVCGAVAAIKKYGAPCIVVDLGTATKISAIAPTPVYRLLDPPRRGHLPVRAVLSHRSAPPHRFKRRAELIGVNSTMSMLSGIVFGTPCMRTA